MPSRSRTEAALRCADHRTLLRSSITTDGDGSLVEYVEACSQCRSRVSFRGAAQSPSARAQINCRERNAEIRARRAAGEQVASIAERFRITTQRVYQICGKNGRG